MSEPEVVQEIITDVGRKHQEQQYQDTGTNGVKVTEQMMTFLQHAISGTLPDPGKVPEADPHVAALAKELLLVHLPEWRNPAGRKLAEPTTITLPQAVRLADYLVKRGVRMHEELEELRWIPTPGGPPGPYDDGLHITPDENGEWPAPDPEVFWDIDDIETTQLEDGLYAARHPRGISYEAATKSEAYAGIVDRIRDKIKEANQQ